MHVSLNNNHIEQRSEEKEKDQRKVYIFLNEIKRVLLFI